MEDDLIRVVSGGGFDSVGRQAINIAEYFDQRAEEALRALALGSYSDIISGNLSIYHLGGKVIPFIEKSRAFDIRREDFRNECHQKLSNASGSKIQFDGKDAIPLDFRAFYSIHTSGLCLGEWIDFDRSNESIRSAARHFANAAGVYNSSPGDMPSNIIGDRGHVVFIASGVSMDDQGGMIVEGDALFISEMPRDLLESLNVNKNSFMLKRTHEAIIRKVNHRKAHFKAKVSLGDKFHDEVLEIVKDSNQFFLSEEARKISWNEFRSLRPQVEMVPEAYLTQLLDDHFNILEESRRIISDQELLDITSSLAEDINNNVLFKGAVFKRR